MINNQNFCSVVITAGGNGSRFSKTQKKQFALLGNKRILDWTILAFYTHHLINEIILTIPQEDYQFCLGIFDVYKDKLKIVVGGLTRQESVFIGLNHCNNNTDFVLIHDGVRPFIKPKEIDDLVQIAYEKQAVIPITKIKNTIKTIKNSYVECTIDRDYCFEVHTPQVFNYKMILDCHKKAIEINNTFTDDAGLCEFFNIPVFTYIVSNYNIKITSPDDTIIASAILKEFIKEVNYA